MFTRIANHIENESAKMASNVKIKCEIAKRISNVLKKFDEVSKDLWINIRT